MIFSFAVTYETVTYQPLLHRGIVLILGNCKMVRRLWGSFGKFSVILNGVNQRQNEQKRTEKWKCIWQIKLTLEGHCRTQNILFGQFVLPSFVFFHSIISQTWYVTVMEKN